MLEELDKALDELVKNIKKWHSLELGVFQDDKLIKIYYYHSNPGFDEYEFFDIINTEENSKYISYLRLSGEDEGQNGIRSWHLGRLAEGNAIFSNLKTFIIEGKEPWHHNWTFVSRYETFEEDGVIGDLLHKMPNLEYLSIPSAPSLNFFSREFHPLKKLQVQTGCESQNFILNLANSTCFRELKELEFIDYSLYYMEEDYYEKCVPFEHYLKLFASDALPKIESVKLINTSMSKEEQNRLKETKVGKKLHTLCFERIDYKLINELYDTATMFEIEEEDIDEAIKYYNAINELYPKSKEIWDRLGSIYFDKKDFDKTIECYKEVVELDDYCDLAWYVMARIESIKENVDMALNYLEKAIEIDDDWKSIASLESDFDNIRNLKRFGTLIH